MVLAPLTARASEGASVPSFAVSIRSESGRTFSVAFRRLDAERWAPPVAECKTPCTLELPKSIYRVEVQRAPDDKLSRKLVLEHPTELNVTRGDKVAYTVGLALGITGPALFAVGVPFLFLGMMCSTPECTGPRGGWPMVSGLSLMAAGAIVAPTGWILYATSKARIKDVTKATPAAGPTLALVPVHGGVGLSGGFVF
jgi:hypothetical protein